jgi:hypothetical protein
MQFEYILVVLERMFPEILVVLVVEIQGLSQEVLGPHG